jgi:hypothetical protein
VVGAGSWLPRGGRRVQRLLVVRGGLSRQRVRVGVSGFGLRFVSDYLDRFFDWLAPCISVGTYQCKLFISASYTGNATWEGMGVRRVGRVDGWLAANSKGL